MGRESMLRSRSRNSQGAPQYAYIPNDSQNMEMGKNMGAMQREHSITFQAMGCQATAHLDITHSDSHILEKVPIWIDDIEASISPRRFDSELTWVNKHHGKWIKVSDTLLANLQSAILAAHLTKGLSTPFAMDVTNIEGDRPSYAQLIEPNDVPKITTDSSNWRNIKIDNKDNRVNIPAPVDFSDTMKGWTARYVARQLRKYGSSLVDIGGVMVACGPHEWHLDIINNAFPASDKVVVKLSEGALVTRSANTQHYSCEGQTLHRIVAPRTDHPANPDILSVTVLHSDVIVAEASARNVMILGGEEGLAWLNSHGHTPGMVICRDGHIHPTLSFASYVVVN